MILSFMCSPSSSTPEHVPSSSIIVFLDILVCGYARTEKNRSVWKGKKVSKERKSIGGVEGGGEGKEGERKRDRETGERGSERDKDRKKRETE